MISMEHFLGLSGVLVALGFYGVLARRSAILILISVELMLAEVSINFITFATYLDPERFTGVIFAIFAITIAAAEVGLALGIVLRLFRDRGTSNVDAADELKW